MTINFNFFNLLTLVFVAAKLFNVIDWSWWLVLAPTLAPLAILIVGLIIGFVYLYFTKD
jgi:hypothetical protein